MFSVLGHFKGSGLRLFRVLFGSFDGSTYNQSTLGSILRLELWVLGKAYKARKSEKRGEAYLRRKANPEE